MESNIITEAVHQYKTPFYIFNMDLLENHIKNIKNSIGENVEICYAMKANPFIIDAIHKQVHCFEVCSPGEFKICERANINMGQVVMSGVYKSEEDIEYAIKTYGSQIIYTVESMAQLKILKKHAEKNQVSISVLLRLTSGNQFGMDKKHIETIIASENSCLFIKIKGIQFYSGTQKSSVKSMEKELDMLCEFCKQLEEDYNFTVSMLEYGPGIPVYYFNEAKQNCTENSIFQGLCDKIRKINFKGKVVLEIGRYIAAECGNYVTSVVDIKTNENQNYCIVDGGINHVNYFGQIMAMKKPPIIHLNKRQGEVQAWNVCGSLCTVNDMLARDYTFTALDINDVLIFEKTGAYSVTEGISLFLSRKLPKVIMYSSLYGMKLVREDFPTDRINYLQEN